MVKKKKRGELSALVAELTKNIDLKTEEDIVSFTNSLRAGLSKRS